MLHNEDYVNMLNRAVKLRGIKERGEGVPDGDEKDSGQGESVGERRGVAGGWGGRGLVYEGEENEMEDGGSDQKRKSEKKKGSGDKQGVIGRRKKMVLERGKDVLEGKK